MQGPYNYSFSAPGRQDLTFDAYTGELKVELSEQDFFFWANYLTSFAEGFTKAGIAIKSWAPDGLSVVRPWSTIANILDLTAVAAEAGNAPTPKDAVQILAAGIASAMVAVSSGYYTGLLAAGLPFALEALGLSFPPFLATLAVLATVGIASYLIERYVDWAVKLIAGEVAGALFDLYDSWPSPILQVFRDPLVLDLDGDGIELSALAGSSVHFDYDRDGFAEKTGWVSADDGILFIDSNGNGKVDDASELFGSPSQDGFAVLETLDSNRDGKIDREDDAFSQLHVWRDLDQDGVSDAGEMMTLQEAGVVSISLVRTDVTGTNNGHGIGFEAGFTRTDGTNGTAQTIYFETDRQDTRADHTPSFVVADGVNLLPQFPGSGQINSIAWKATTDAGFRAAWTAFTDQAAALAPDELRTRFADLLLKWAGVDGTDQNSRGSYVNAQHLVFVEKFFGSPYQEIYANQGVATSPARPEFGAAIEASFDAVVDAMLSAFLSQVGISVLSRGGSFDEVVSSPYFAYAMLDFDQTDEGATNSFGNVAQVVELITQLVPINAGTASEYVVRAMGGLDGVAKSLFGGHYSQYWSVIEHSLAGFSDPLLRQIASAIAKGEAAFGSNGDDGLIKLEGDNLFDAGHGDDVLISGAGSDIFIFRSGDGSDVIRDASKSMTEVDTLVLTDLLHSNLIFERIGDTLQIRIVGSDDTILSENFFYNWDNEARGIDRIRFADGTELSRDQIGALSTTVGDDRNNDIRDTAQADVLGAGRGDDQITITGGSDTILYARGDGYDSIVDTSGLSTETDKLKLLGLNPGDVELSRVGNDLVVLVKASGEQITSVSFFAKDAATGMLGSWGIEQIEFQNGVTWGKSTIAQQAWIRGNDVPNGLKGDTTDDTFVGGKGNDTLDGGLGSDTYVWKSGDGSDSIIEGSNDRQKVDRLVLEGVRSGDVELLRRGTSLVIAIKSSGETISISDQYYGVQNINEDWNKYSYGLEEIVFANGARWGRDVLMKNIVNPGFDQDVSFLIVGGGFVYRYFTDEFGRQGNIFFGAESFNELHGKNDIGIGTDFDDRIGDGAWGDGSAGPDNNTVSGASNAGHNVFDGGKGNDVLIGGSGHDVLIGGEGNDVIYGDAESQAGDTGPSHDTLDGGDGDDRLYAGAGNDVLSGGAGNDLLSGGDGSDTLQETGVGNDTFVGGRGDDQIVSSASSSNSGSDVFVYARGHGNDLIIDESTSTSEIDVLKFTDINQDDVLLSSLGRDLTIRILSTGETIYVSSFFAAPSASIASIGIDRIDFADGSSWGRGEIEQRAWVRGTEGRDVLQNSSIVNSTFVGHGGDDIIVSAPIRGSANLGSVNGSDTFIYASGDGNDVIFDGSHATTNVEVDTLILTDLNREDVRLSRTGIDLIIQDQRTGQTITNEGFFWNWDTTGQGIDVIRFADGTSWDRVQMRDNAWEWGSVAKDYLKAEHTYDNVFVGGRGDDILQSATARGSSNGGGANGNDRFLYKLGDGNDLIFDGSHSLAEKDRLVLGVINPDDVRLSVSGLDLVIKILPTGHQIIDEGSMWSRQSVGQGLDEIEFANGTVWTREDIRFWAQEGSLFYSGTVGADRIVGSHLDQRLSGNQGDDFIDGRGGSDLVFGDSGNDTLAMTVANIGELDRLDGGDGTDAVSFEGLSTSVFIDLVLNNGEVRTSDAASPSSAEDRLIATVAAVENVVGTQFDDRVFGNDAANTLYGKSGSDILDGRSGNDTLEGGTGDDTLMGYLGNDTYVFSRGDGSDVIIEGDGQGTDTLRLKGIQPSEVSLARSGSDLLVSIAGNAGGTLRLTAATETFRHYDQYGIDEIIFDNGTKWDAAYLRQWSIYASATDGDDTLVGTAASGGFGGGKGNDNLNAGTGDDTYYYARGDGHDTITEASYSGVTDKLVLEGISSSEVSLTRAGNDVTLALAESAPGAGNAGSVLLKDSLDDGDYRGVEQIVFADGTTWTRASLRTLLLDQASSSGNDSITGFNSADVIRGMQGNDSLNGGVGDDTYYYGRGDGHDTITEASYSGVTDKLVLEGISAPEVSLVRAGNDVTLVFAETAPGAGNAGSVLLKANLDDVDYRGIEQIVFAGGATWTRANLRTLLLEQASTSGNDTITGFNVADSLAGGAGNDAMNGAADNDTYVYARGDGNDTITEDAWNGTSDQLVFTDINPADITLARNGTDLTILIAESAPDAGNAGTILIKDTLDSSYDRGIEKIVFANGTTWSRADMSANVVYIAGSEGNDTITGTAASDSQIRAGLGNDVLNGLTGSDTYIYRLRDGNDAITEATSGTDVDTLAFADLNLSDIRFERPSGNTSDVVIRVLQTGETITLTSQFNQAGGVERITFADGTVLGGSNWSLDTYLQSAVVIYGTSGNDTLAGTNGNDVFVGGLGDDRFNSGAGSDTYVYSSGAGSDYIDDESGSTTDVDIVKLTDLNVGDVTFSRSGVNVKITVNSTGQVITLDEQLHSTTANWGVEQIHFANGTTWNRDQIRDAAWIRGTSGNDTLNGTSGTDTFAGGLGDDRYNSGAGSDTYVYASGDGSDYIDDESGSTTDVDLVKLTDLNVGDLTFSRSGVHVAVKVNSTGQVITLDEQLHSTTANWGIEQIQFADGTVWGRTQIQAAAWIRGTTGNDTLAGTSGNDTLFGDAGNDTITAGAGSDIIVFKPNFGIDTVTDFQVGAGSADVLELDNSLFADFEAVLAAAAQIGNDTVITHDSNNTITLKNVAMANLHVDDFRFGA